MEAIWGKVYTFEFLRLKVQDIWLQGCARLGFQGCSD